MDNSDRRIQIGVIGGRYCSEKIAGVAEELGRRKPVFGIGSWDIPGVVKVADAAESIRRIKEMIGE